MRKAKERIATEINKCVQITETISYCTWRSFNNMPRISFMSRDIPTPKTDHKTISAFTILLYTSVAAAERQGEQENARTWLNGQVWTPREGLTLPSQNSQSDLAPIKINGSYDRMRPGAQIIIHLCFPGMYSSFQVFLSVFRKSSFSLLVLRLLKQAY